MSTSTENIAAMESRLIENYYSVTTYELSVVSMESTNPVVLNLLASDDDETIREDVAANENTSAETLTALSTDDDEGVRNFVARNPNTPPELLRGMDENDVWDYFTAQNINCPPDLLLEIVKRDSSYDARLVIARRDDLTDELALIIIDISMEVARIELAKRTSNSKVVMQALINDRGDGVVKAVMDNPHTPTEALNVISKQHRSLDTREYASMILGNRLNAGEPLALAA